MLRSSFEVQSKANSREILMVKPCLYLTSGLPQNILIQMASNSRFFRHLGRVPICCLKHRAALCFCASTDYTHQQPFTFSPTQGAMRNLLSGEATASVDAGTEAACGRMTGFLRGLKEQKSKSFSVYVWYDYFSIPQHCTGMLKDPGMEEEQRGAIASIPAYVAKPSCPSFAEVEVRACSVCKM